jgi:hypothetical protein
MLPAEAANNTDLISASLAVRLYCRRFAFAFTNDVKIELAVELPLSLVSQYCLRVGRFAA